MKRLVSCLFILALVGCSNTPVKQDTPTTPDITNPPVVSVIQTNEEALLALSSEDLVLISPSSSTNAFALNANDMVELIELLNDSSLTGKVLEGTRVDDLEYVLMRVHGEEYWFFGRYYMTSENGVDTFYQMDSSKIYDLFMDKMNLTLTVQEEQWLASDEFPEKSQDTEWLEQERIRKEEEQKRINSFIDHYNQLDLATLPIYFELGIPMPEHTEIDSLDGFRNVRHYEEGVAVDKHFNNDYYVEMYYYMDQEPLYTLYINDRFMSQNAQLITSEHEIATFAYNALNTELLVNLWKSGTGIDSITFEGYTNQEIKEIQHKYETKGISTGDMSFKISHIEDHLIQTREDILAYYQQYFTEVKSQYSTEELFNTTFSEREDGVYMNVTPHGNIVTDFPSLDITTYMLDTEDAVYVYYQFTQGITEQYHRYLRYEFTKTPDGLRY
ncbi:MAG: hypothetical protein IJP28_02555 [Erysipelotrichales bacterium]|nr:hypothetical protein [Erysipelotrichales bacterium]